MRVRAVNLMDVMIHHSIVWEWLLQSHGCGGRGDH